MSESQAYIIRGNELLAQADVTGQPMVAEPPKEHVNEASISDPAFAGSVAIVGAFIAFSSWIDRNSRRNRQLRRHQG